MEYIKSLEEVMEAASIIHNVASNSWKRHDAPDCPHGNVPAYPAHGVWCDDCFNRLQFALDAAEIERNSLPTTHAPDLLPCGHHMEHLVRKGRSHWCAACEVASDGQNQISLWAGSVSG